LPLCPGLRNDSEKGAADKGGIVEILREIWNLILASLPTTIIVFLFFLFARAVFFGPMTRILNERAARTEGARSEAARLESQAQEKLGMYHRALDKIRAEIYSEQDAARRTALDERAAFLRENRARAAERVRQAKEGLDSDLAAQRGQIELEGHSLAEEAVRIVLSGAGTERLSVEDA
jgi:F-type H+-transporting ATPase subunit b